MPPLCVVCAIIENQDRVLVAQRPAGKAQPLKWEFPGGKVEAGEAPEAALRREIREELGVELTIGEALPPAVWDYESFAIELVPFRCAVLHGEPTPHEHAALRWVRRGELGELDWAPADLPVLADYLERLVDELRAANAKVRL
jgi:8-oxo-dGTP diphosphatase